MIFNAGTIFGAEKVGIGGRKACKRGFNKMASLGYGAEVAEAVNPGGRVDSQCTPSELAALQKLTEVKNGQQGGKQDKKGALAAAKMRAKLAARAGK